MRIWLHPILFIGYFIPNNVVGRQMTLLHTYFVPLYDKFHQIHHQSTLEDLETLNELPTNFMNIKLRNPVKILKLKKDLIKNKANLYGVKFSFYYYQGGYMATTFSKIDSDYKFRSVSTNEGHFTYCSIFSCGFGPVFFDRYTHANMLSDQKSSDNRFHFLTIDYNKNYIRLSSCPYERWFDRNIEIKFTISPHLKDNGYFDSGNLGKNYIMTPIYPLKQNDNFFVCGILKQPRVHDIQVGHIINRHHKKKQYESQVDVLKDNLVCKNIDNVNQIAHFGYLNKIYNVKNKDIIERIEVTSSKKYKLYSGQIILFYSKKEIEDELKKMKAKNIYKIDEKGIIMDPACMRFLVNTIEATLVPTTESLDSVTKGSKPNEYYLFVEKNNLDRKLNVKCLSKVKNDGDYVYDQFYSRAANIVVRKYQHDDTIETKNTIHIVAKRDMKAFGRYTCIPLKTTGGYKKDFITNGITYVLPAEGLKFNFDDIAIDENYVNNASCVKKYSKWSEIKSMKICCKSENNKDIVIDDFSNSNISTKDNKVIYNGFFNYTTVTVLCEYKTIGDSIFVTEQKFQYPMYKMNVTVKKNVIRQNVTFLVENKTKDPNTLPLFIGACLIILIILVTVILSFVIILRKKKKRRKSRMRGSLTSTTGATSVTRSKLDSSIADSKSTFKIKRKKGRKKFSTTESTSISSSTSKSRLKSFAKSISKLRDKRQNIKKFPQKNYSQTTTLGGSSKSTSNVNYKCQNVVIKPK